jgi:hypothetical protein
MLEMAGRTVSRGDVERPVLTDPDSLVPFRV